MVRVCPPIGKGKNVCVHMIFLNSSQMIRFSLCHHLGRQEVRKIYSCIHKHRSEIVLSSLFTFLNDHSKCRRNFW